MYSRGSMVKKWKFLNMFCPSTLLSPIVVQDNLIFSDNFAPRTSLLKTRRSLIFEKPEKHPNYLKVFMIILYLSTLSKVKFRIFFPKTVI